MWWILKDIVWVSDLGYLFFYLPLLFQIVPSPELCIESTLCIDYNIFMSLCRPIDCLVLAMNIGLDAWMALRMKQ